MTQQKQELFRSKSEIKRERARKLLREKAIILWRVNAVEYRELPGRYKELLEQREQHPYIHVGRLKKRILDEYPKIPFLEVLSEEEALKMLDQWERKNRLAKEVELLEDTLVTDNTLNTLRSWCRDFTYNVTKENYAKDKARRLRGDT